VDDPQIAEILRLVDDRGEGGPDAGSGRGQWDVSVGSREVRGVTSTAVYINRS
jgi:hypothetical protein